MVTRASVEFVPAPRPITEPITKFGGEPVWLHKPQWPLSKSTGRPMQFVCQIALDRKMFGDMIGQMAYVFMTHDQDDEWVDGTWEADAGENAVVVQPGIALVPTQQLEEGPALYAMVETPGHNRLHPVPVEFAVNLVFSDDPDFVEQENRAQWSVYCPPRKRTKRGRN